MTNRRDLLAGGSLVVAGVVIAATARGFPVIGGMPYGPGLFPTIVAVGLILSGVGIAAEAWGGAVADGEPLRPIPLLTVVAIVAGFALLLAPLGFHVAATLALLAAVRLFGGGWVMAAIFAPLAAILLHAVFYSVMRVPLPWGVLLPVAW